MTISKTMFQAGTILHEVIVGAFRAKGTNFRTWCIENEVGKSAAHQITHGQAKGPQSQKILEKMIADAGYDVVQAAYSRRMQDEAERLKEVAA